MPAAGFQPARPLTCQSRPSRLKAGCSQDWLPHPRYGAACMSMLCSFGALAGPNVAPSSLTIVYRFAGPYSEQSVLEMKRELGSIMKGSGVEIDWRGTRGTGCGVSRENASWSRFPIFMTSGIRWRSPIAATATSCRSEKWPADELRLNEPDLKRMRPYHP